MRRALSLIRQLPADSAVVLANTPDDPDEGWGPGEFLLARLIDEVASQRYVTQVGLQVKPKSGKPKPPEPVWRPGMERAEPTSNGQPAAKPKRLPREDPDEFFGKVTREVSAN